MKIAFDIGGVLTKHPKLIEMAKLLKAAGAEVFIITDMDILIADNLLFENNLSEFMQKLKVADWQKHGDMCKSILCESLGIDILIDDFAPYLADGNFVGLTVAPRPKIPYYSEDWKN